MRSQPHTLSAFFIMMWGSIKFQCNMQGSGSICGACTVRRRGLWQPGHSRVVVWQAAPKGRRLGLGLAHGEQSQEEGAEGEAEGMEEGDDALHPSEPPSPLLLPGPCCGVVGTAEFDRLGMEEQQEER